jgi:hypothetical protein
MLVEREMAKNILIFADGTGNEGGIMPDESRTNAYKLFRATIHLRFQVLGKLKPHPSPLK